MPLTREKKKQVIKDLEEKIEQQKSVVFFGFQKIKVKDFSELRKKIKKAGGDLMVAKKTLANLAFKRKGFKINVRELGDEIALAFGLIDAISAIKLVYQASFELKNIKILAGIFEGEFIDKEKIIEIAKMPAREELLGGLVRIFSAPVSGFINVLQGNIKGLINVLAKAKI